MMDAQLKLPDDRDGVGPEVVVVHSHAAENCILNRHCGPVYRALLNGAEHVLEGRAGMEINLVKDAVDRLFAKGAGLALKGNAMGHTRIGLDGEVGVESRKK